MATVPPCITLIHLSDIHFVKGVSNVLASDIDAVVRNEIERDAALITSGRSLSGIIVAGDIAFSGKTEEFQTGIDWLGQLSQKLAVDPSLVWCVPGNHDVDRSVLRSHTSLEPIHNEIRSSATLHQTLEKHLQGQDGPLLFEPLRAYNETLGQRFGCITKPDKPWWEFDLTLSDGSLLRMRGLNSALISGEHDSRDTKKLCLGPAQYELRREDDVTHLVICHHPPDWLVDGDDARQALKAYAKIILTGHKHNHEEEQINDTLWLSSGAVHPSRTESRWQPNYYMLQIRVDEADTGRWLVVDLYRRVWDEVRRTFVRPAGQTQDFKTYRLPLGPWTPRASAGNQQEAVRQEGEQDMSLSRKKLLYAFVSLPYHTRVSIMEKLKLFDESNRGLPDEVRFASGFDKAVNENRLPEVWDAVDALSRHN